MQKIDKMLQRERDRVANTILFLVGVLSVIPTTGSVIPITIQDAKISKP